MAMASTKCGAACPFPDTLLVSAIDAVDGSPTHRGVSFRFELEESQGTGSHDWFGHRQTRELIDLGHDVRLMPLSYVKPYVKRQKNNIADAEAICEAVPPPTMRFVPVKSPEQQSVVALHRTRSILIRQRIPDLQRDPQPHGGVRHDRRSRRQGLQTLIAILEEPSEA